MLQTMRSFWYPDSLFLFHMFKMMDRRQSFSMNMTYKDWAYLSYFWTHHNRLVIWFEGEDSSLVTVFVRGFLCSTPSAWRSFHSKYFHLTAFYPTTHTITTSDKRILNIFGKTFRKLSSCTHPLLPNYHHLYDYRLFRLQPKLSLKKHTSKSEVSKSLFTALLLQ